MNVKTSAEKEWLRKLTTGQPTHKEEVKAPQRTAEALPPSRKPSKKSRMKAASRSPLGLQQVDT